MVINTCSVGPGHVFEFQISIDLGRSHPGHPSPSAPLVLTLEEQWKGSVCVWGVGDTCASACILWRLQRNVRGGERAPSSPLSFDDLLPLNQLEAAEAAVAIEVNFWFRLKESEEWLGSKCL